MTDDIGPLAFAAALALAAAAGILLIDDDVLRVLFLVGVCVVALGSSLLRAESDSPGAEGADFLVPLIAAILVSSVAFDDDQEKLASVVVLTLVFSVAWRALRSRRGRRLA